MTDTLKLEQYDFVSFCQDMYEAFKQGYEPVWTSDDSPQQIGFCFHAILHKKPVEPVIVGKAVFEASIDTVKLQEQLKEGGEIEQMLADSLVVAEMTAIDDFLLVSDDIKEALSSGIVEDVKIEDLQAVETPVKQTTKRGKKA